MIDVMLMDHLPNGLPDTLLENDSNGAPRLLHLLPHPDRSYRRWIARLIRQKLKLEGSDTDVLFRYFCKRRLRQLQFWSAAERIENGSFKHDSFPFSLDLILLQRIDDGDAPAEFDEVRFTEVCPEWPILKANIERLTERSFESVPAKALRLLMLWPIVQERIGHWKDDEPKDWPTLEAIFSLSSITDSPWFINQAMLLSPNVRSRLQKIFQQCDKDSQLAMSASEASDDADVDGPSDPLSQKPASTEDIEDMKIAGTDWPTLAARIAEVGTLMSRSLPVAWSGRRAEMIAVLEDALAALKQCDPQEEARARLNKGIEEFSTRLAGLDQEPDLDSVISELGIRLSEWQSQTKDAPAHDVVKLGSALWVALSQLDGQLVVLREAHEKHVAVRQKHLLAQKTAEERPSITTRRAAAVLRAEDSAAEGCLLDAHDSLLQLFVVPRASDHGAPPTTEELESSVDLQTVPILSPANSSQQLKEAAALRSLDETVTRVNSTVDDESIKKDEAQEGTASLHTPPA